MKATTLAVADQCSRAKKAEAAFKISFARRSSRFSLSNSTIRRRWSTAAAETLDSALRTHRRTVSGVGPSICATARIAAHSEEYTPSRTPSRTIRTARSRNSVALPNRIITGHETPSSQDRKPPRNPGGFISQVREALHSISPPPTPQPPVDLSLRRASKAACHQLFR